MSNISLDTWWIALENSGLAAAIREGAWTYPAIQTLHLAGVVSTLGLAMVFDLRLLGFARSLPVWTLADWLLPIARIAFVVALFSGVLLFAADAVALSNNRLLHVKFLALVIAGANAWLFHRRHFTRTHPPSHARLTAVISLAAWAGVLVTGRLLPYAN